MSEYYMTIRAGNRVYFLFHCRTMPLADDVYMIKIRID